MDGKTYHNVIVGTVEADQVHITYDGGIGSIPLSELPPDVQKQLGYDPQKAATAAQIRALQAQVSDLTQKNAALRQALARYQGALNDAQTQAAAKPKSSVAAYHCYLYQTVVGLLYMGRVASGPYTNMTEAESTVYAQQKWAQMPESQKSAYEQMAETTGDPIAEKEAQAALQPPDTQHHGAREQTVDDN